MLKYLITAAVLITSFIIIWVRKSKENDTEKQTEETMEQMAENNPYEDLRNAALTINAEEIGIQIPPDRSQVYGIVMDWEMGGAVATTVAYLSGDASMYLSTGGGVLGGVGHEEVRTAIEAYIMLGQDYLQRAEKTERTPLPENNCVRFYLLTNQGIFTYQESLENFKEGTSEWLPLFDEANQVLGELRVLSEKWEQE